MSPEITPAHNTDPTDEILRSIEELLQLLEEDRAELEQLATDSEADNNVELRDRITFLRQAIQFSQKHLIGDLSEITDEQLFDYDTAVKILRSAEVPVTTEPAEAYTELRERLTPGIRILLDATDGDEPLAATIMESPRLYVADEPGGEIAATAAFRIPLKFSDGTNDDAIVYPRRSKTVDPGKMIISNLKEI